MHNVACLMAFATKRQSGGSRPASKVLGLHNADLCRSLLGRHVVDEDAS